MKDEIQKFTDDENAIKERYNRANEEKAKFKQHCDQMKTSIKGNREKYRTMEKEFEGVLEDEG